MSSLNIGPKLFNSVKILEKFWYNKLSGPWYPSINKHTFKIKWIIEKEGIISSLNMGPSFLV